MAFEFNSETFLKAIKGEKFVYNGTQYTFLVNPENDLPHVDLSDCIVRGTLRFSENDIFPYEIRMNKVAISNANFKGTFMGDLSIHKSTMENIIFEKCSIKRNCIFSENINNGSVSFYESEFKSLEFRSGHFKETIGIDLCTISELQFGNAIFEKTIQYRGRKINELIIDGAIINELLIYDGDIDKLDYYKGSITKFLISGHSILINELSIDSTIDSEININGARINDLLIHSHIKKNGSFILSDTQINKILFTRLQNSGELMFSNIKSSGRHRRTKKKNDRNRIYSDPSDSLLSIDQSDLGSTSFFNFDFYSFTSIVIKQSRVSDIKTTNIHIPVFSEKIISSGTGKYEAKYQEEFYNQLYLAMQKQGNRTQEIKYYSEYLECHRLSKIEDLNQPENIWNKIFSRDWSTPMSLYLHRLSSSYGTNWARSVFFIILLSFLFYFAYTKSLPEIKFGYEYLTIENIGFHIAHYFRFILPTHDWQLIDGTSSNGISSTIDFFGRIVNGFLIYQTIAAFRRFGRR